MDKTTRRSRLRRLLQEDRLIIAPGVCNALFAKIVEDIGFDVVYLSGAGVANAYIGAADFGLQTMSEIRDHAYRVCCATELPVICDIDNGFGNPLNVYRTVTEFENTGVAAIHIEDQVFPKRCGHFVGKSVIPAPEMIAKIKAALDARKDEDMIIIARTDAIHSEGFEAAIERAAAYTEAGADMTFVEAPRTVEQLESIPKRLQVPQVVNIVEGGLTPQLPYTELNKMGFKLAIYANLTLRAAIKAVQDVLKSLKETGSSLEVTDKIITMEERGRLTGFNSLREMEKRYGVFRP